MADANQGQEQGEGQGGKKLNLGKILLPVFAVINLGVVGGGAFLVHQSTLGFKPKTLREPAAAEEFKKSREKIGMNDSARFTMPTFTANLAGSPRRLIRVELTFEMLDKDGFEEIVRNSPAARDLVLRILNRTTFDEIESIQGKLALKDKIAVALNHELNAGVVKDIYFGEFVVQ